MNENLADPTFLTEQRIERAATAERDYTDGKLEVLRTRLEAIDEATRVLATTVNKVPSEIEKEITHLTSVMEEKFDSVSLRFSERDDRSERESRDNKVAVDAAFAAQKEAAAEQNKANTKAIDKSEEATNEAIAKLSELFESRTKAQSDKVDDLKDRIQSMESSRNGENRIQERVSAAMIGWATAGALVLSVLTALIVKFA